MQDSGGGGPISSGFRICWPGGGMEAPSQKHGFWVKGRGGGWEGVEGGEGGRGEGGGAIAAALLAFAEADLALAVKLIDADP